VRSYHVASFGEITPMELREAPTPDPGPNEVLVRVHANSLNYRDLALRLYGERIGLQPGLVPLSDGAGEVVKTGANVTRFKEGDRVAATFHQAWIDGRINAQYASKHLGGSIDGMLADHVVLSEEGLVALPEHLTYEEAATLPCAGVTAWTALHGDVPVRPGDTVLVQGTGGLSISALQLAKLEGARVIATTSTEEKADRLRALGADEVVLYTEHPNWDEHARAFTDGEGVDFVIEVGGSDTFATSTQALRIGGRMVLIGALTTGGSFDPAALIASGKSIEAIMVGNRAGFEALNRAIAQHELRPVIDTVFPFEQADDAFSYFNDRRHFGKVVIAG
jgi:NADPH:quinone reductase-like Zn-dependent oxidoreductase